MLGESRRLKVTDMVLVLLVSVRALRGRFHDKWHFMEATLLPGGWRGPCKAETAQNDQC